MTLILTYGEAGDGKSTQHATICECTEAGKAIYLSMEIKDDKLLKWKNINYVNIIQYNEMYEEDGPATLKVLEGKIREIIRDNKFSVVVLDGISDIRRFAKKEWIDEDNRIRISKGEKPRAGISGENKSAWAAINQRVMGILEPLINWSNIKHTNVFFTAQMKDTYVKDTKVGRSVAAGDWVEFDVDVKCHFYRTAEGINMAHFTKIPGWANVAGKEDEVPIHKDEYYGLLAERELI
jgi:hypothetical protein